MLDSGISVTETQNVKHSKNTKELSLEQTHTDVNVGNPSTGAPHITLHLRIHTGQKPLKSRIMTKILRECQPLSKYQIIHSEINVY